MKIIKKIYNDKNIILIYQKKNKNYVDKIFDYKNLILFKNEILGIKYFTKNKYFEIPKLYSYKIKKKSGIITQEYIKGKRASLFNLKKVYKKTPTANYKINVENYIKNLRKIYKNKNNILRVLKINFLIKNKKVIVSKTHGDLVYYNCIKKDKNIYVFDFEKFRERIAVYDYFNWFFHPISFNFSKIFFQNNRNYFIKIYSALIIFILNFLIKCFTKNIFIKLKISHKDLDLYYYLYLYEKILIINNDLNFVRNQKLKMSSIKYIKFLIFLIQNLFQNMNKKNNK